MRKVKTIFNYVRHAAGSKILVASAFVILSGAAITFGLFNPAKTNAAVDCDNNAVIKCGYSNLGDFWSKFQQNPYGDLQNIYGNWGVTGNEVANQSQHVTVYKNGEIKTDDGTIVATDAYSLGRQSGSTNRSTINIAGNTYYYSKTQISFAANSLDGYAVFNSDDHSMKLAVLTACGNPSWGKSPGYKCEMLQQTKVSDSTYRYVATPYVKDGATVTKIVYDFGDGKSKTITSNFDQEVTHTYAPGQYTAKATVYFNVNGSEKSDTRVECTKLVDVPQPPTPIYECSALTAKKITRTNYEFTATTSASGGAVLKTANFSFGDSQSAKDLTTNDGTTVTTKHEYAKAGTYTIVATANFNIAKEVKSVNCETTITIDDEETPETPEELPSTGPAELLGGALGAGSIAAAGRYYVRTRRDIKNTIFKK
ncbi:MAG: hypothetical protein PVI21_00850 [Candidatus Woesebacteria bacterium]|jgi:hypothetical protein